jgi:hypothetical protein
MSNNLFGFESLIRKDEGPIKRKGREERDEGIRDISVSQWLWL